MGRLAVEVLAKEAKALVKPVEKEPELWFQAISTTGWLGPVPVPVESHPHKARGVGPGYERVGQKQHRSLIQW